MSTRRLLLVHSVLALLVGGSLYALVTGREYWPFSPYAMYSEAERARSLSRLWLFGVSASAPHEEISLHASKYIRPFYKSRLIPALERIARDPRRETGLREALQDCLRRYEKLRLAGRHEGPPLRGVRLYRMQWELDPWARNVDEPSRRTLIAEVNRAEAGSWDAGS
jgi:hypothetical protein